MVEAYQTSKGVGLIFPDEGKVRGPYTVRVMMTPKKTKTVIKSANPSLDPELLIQMQEKLYQDYREAGNALKQWDSERSSVGLTPDHIKFSPEYREAKRIRDAAFQTYRNFNARFGKAITKYQRAKKRSNPMRPQRRTTLADARAYLRNKLGPLRKANPKKISKLIDEAEIAGEQWGSRHKARKGGRISQDVLYSMGRQYSGDVVGSEGPLPTGHRELVAMGYKTGVRRGLRNPSARDKFQVWGGVYGTEPIGKPKAAKSAVSAAIKHALSTNDRVTVRGNAPDAVLYIEKVSPSAVSVLVTREFRDLSRIGQSDVERMRGVVKRNPARFVKVGYQGAGRTGYDAAGSYADGIQSLIEDAGLSVEDIKEAQDTESLYFGVVRPDGVEFQLRVSDHSPTGRSGYRASSEGTLVQAKHDKASIQRAIKYMLGYKKPLVSGGRYEIGRNATFGGFHIFDNQERDHVRGSDGYPLDFRSSRAAQKEIDRLVGKRNPAVSYEGPGLYKKFHGKPSTKTVVVKTIHNSRDDLANLGTLVEIKVDLATGQRATIEFPATGPDKVMLCSSPDGKQLYFVGGDQSLDLASMGMGSRKWHRDLMVLGIADEVTYRTRKGFDKFQLIDYYHELGEVTKKKPFLLYDTLNHELQIAGGQYEVKPEGIVN